ncbi:hypothetical protein PtB15_2B686 [Puccinia triticina]|nr:hypothetical protein PtB15_2B686 [Puccinia triticina]
MSESPSEHSSNGSILSESTQPSSIRDSSDGGQSSPVSEISELSSKEIQALKQYSHSVQNFTYQLFENFRLELEAKGRPSPSVNVNDPLNLVKPKSEMGKRDNIAFHSTDLVIDNSEIVHQCNATDAQTNNYSGRRKPSDYPRRKKRPGPDFPEDTGL